MPRFVINSKTNVIKIQGSRVSSGTPGPKGDKGDPGQGGGTGVIPGGTSNQALTKIDGIDGNVQWSSITKTFVGLGNVDNTSDVSKPVSTAVTTALTLKEPVITAGAANQYWRGDKTWVTLDKIAVGLPNVDNTSDAAKFAATAAFTNKQIDGTLNTLFNIPQSAVSGLTAALAATATDSNVVHIAGTEAITGNKDFQGSLTSSGALVVTVTDGRLTDQRTPLDGSVSYSKLSAGTATTGQVLSYNGTTLVWSTPTSSGSIGDASSSTKGVIQLAGDLSGTAGAPTVPGLASKANSSDVTTGLAAKEPTITAGTTAQYYRGDKSWQTLNKAAVGLSNVDNTADASKPISAATQTALNAKPDTSTLSTVALTGSYNDLLNKPTFTGSDATTTSKGIVQLAQDLGGTAAAPTVTFANDTLHLLLTGGTITGDTKIIKGSGGDALLSIQNQAGSRGAYFNLIANGGANPYLSLTGFSGTGTDGTAWNKLWQIGNNNSVGFTIWTNSSSGSGYNTAPAILINYSQDITTYGNLLTATTLTKNIGSPTAYFANMYNRKVYFNPAAAIDGTVAGVMLLTGSFKIIANAAAGRVLTSDGSGLLTLQDPAGGADASSTGKGVVQLTNDLSGTAASPQVTGAHMTSSGFFMTDLTGTLWRVTINSDGSLQTRAVTTGTSTGQAMGLALALTYA